VRVLQVGAFPYPSDQGTQLLLTGTTRALREAGHHVEVAVYGHGDGDGVERPDLVHRVGAPPGYRRMRSGPDGVKPWLDLALAVAVGRLVRQRGYDVVHAHSHEALLACWAALRRARRRPALVYGEHTKMADELPTFVRGTGPIGRLLDRAETLADGVIALHAPTAGSARSGGARAVIPPGVYADAFAGVTARRAGRARALVYAGTPDRFQGVGVLGRVLDALPGWRLVLVGPAWTPALARAVHANATPIPASWGEARSFIAGADVAIVPRVTCAGFPMKLLNYAMLGVPTVVTPACARGVPGEVVAEPHPAALAEGVNRAASAPRVDPAEVLAGWGWARRIPAIVDLYEQAVVTARAAGS